MRVALYLLSLALLAWAAVVVRLPIALLSPAPVLALEEVIDVEADRPLSDQLLVTAVELRQGSAARVVQGWLRTEEDVRWLPTIVPAGVEPERFADTQLDIFAESVRVAAAVGLREAGEDVRIEGDGARVARVLPGSPADGALEQGDVITAVGDQPIEVASQLVTAVSQLDDEALVELTVQRGDEEMTVTVPLQLLPGADRPAIGVLVETVNQQIELPLEVQVDADTAVGGPSAGLVLALASYDLVTDADLAGDRLIAGTGAVDLDGRVGVVGGVWQKVVAAVDAGADVFLVPQAELDRAREAADGALEVIGVSTVEEAITALGDR